MIILSDNTIKLAFYCSAGLTILFIFVLILNSFYIPKAAEIDMSEISVLSQPIQKETIVSEFVVSRKGKELKVIPLADFDINGVVVSTKRYYSGFDAAVVPIDIGIVWGEITKPENIANIYFEQIVRFLRYRITGDLPFGYDYINKNVANIHAVPENKKIKRVLNSINKYDKVHLKGYLIQIESISNKNYRRRSSLTRDDTGDGACEVMWINHVKINHKIYY